MNDSRRGSLRIGVQESKAKANRRRVFLHIGIVLALFGAFSSLQAQTPITAGYRDFYYGPDIFEAPTAEKPQSKLWWNDGSWWGILWNTASNQYRIHRFDLAAQSWINTGPDADERDQSLADALWDGQKLYVASHVHNNSGTQSSGNTTAANSARLYRYSYDAATDTYSLDAGFPVLVNSATSETLVLDKDSTGQLWVTWTQANKVYVNCSQGDDLTWGTPFVMPTYGSNLSSDDISTVIAFNNKVGVAWSNQSDKKIYFAIHLDNKPDTDWETREIALEDSKLGAVVDDHLNMKLTSDGGGNLYLALKTSLSGSSNPGIYLLKRSFGGGWSKYVVATNADDYTRPIVVIDDENRDLYIFGRSGNHINYKKVSLSNISFPAGTGNVFIESSGNVDINDATSSKHNLNSTTGLLILASCEVSRFYYHNYMALASSGPPPTISSFAPTSGPAGTSVTVDGDHFNGTTSVAFDGNAGSFIVNSNTQITATVPAGATTGKISVAKSTGTAVSVDDFTVTAPPQYTLTVNADGFGNVTPSGGAYDAGTMVTLTAIPGAGYQFSGWSGDLSGAANPATITMDANKNITATFALSSGGGPIAFEEAQTGSSGGSATVASASITGVSGHLYLAAIALKQDIAVNSVSGLGLNWTRVKVQCAGRNQSRVEVWKAIGAPNGNGAITAAFASAPDYTVIAVSRYSGADVANPIGNIVSGNTAGANGSCSGGSDNASYSFNLTTGNDGMVYGAATMRNRTHSPGAGYTERAEIMQGGGGSGASIAVQDKSVNGASSVVVNGSFSGSIDWAVVAFEINPSSGGGTTQYTLATTISGSGTVALNPPGGTYDAGTEVTLTATPAAGFQFSGWSGDLSGATNPATLTMDANKNVTATFTALPTTQYTLTTTISGSGTVALNPPGGTYDAGTVVTLTATPAAGFQFSGWSGDLSGATNPATLTMDANKNVTATFTALPPNQFTLTTTINGSGSVALNPAGGTYDAGTEITLTATPAAGFQFSGWSGDLSGATNPATLTMDANKNVTATFTALPPTQYTLTTTITGSGTVALNPAGGTYDAGTEVTLTATPAAGYQFSGWSGDLSGAANPATLTMDANKNVTAAFTISGGGGGSGQIVYEETQTGGSTNSAAVTTAGNLAAVNGDLYLAAITSKPNVVVSSVSGLGLIWTPVKAQCAGRSQTRVEVWMAQGTPAGNSPVTATLASAPSAAAIAVSRYSGVDAVSPIGNMISGNTTGADGTCSGGVDNVAYSFNLSTTSNDAMIYCVAAMRNRTHTPGAGYTERVEFMASSGGSAASLAVQEQSFTAATPAAVEGSFSGSVDWAVVALEIKPQLTMMSKQNLAAEFMPMGPASEFGLEQNVPNPFAGSTTINFSLRQACNVLLEVYDANGRVVRTLVTGEMEPGRYSVNWDGNDEFNNQVAPGTYSYKLYIEMEDGDHLFTRTRQMVLAPPAFQLQQNYPNPFNPSTQIRFDLPQASRVTIKVYTANGAEVRTVVDKDYPAGAHAVTFQANNLPSGNYFYVMQAGAVRKVQQFTLVK